MKFHELDLPTLDDFQDLCRNHDWTYSKTEDFDKWLKGRKAQILIDTIVKHGGEKFYNIWETEAKRAGVL